MMKLLTRYVVIRLTVTSCYVLFAMLALYSFIDLLSEIGRIGKGNYSIFGAVQYIMMLMPARAYQLMPLATLIGGLIALGNLSNNSELAVIKTSGMSTGNLISMILTFSVFFSLITAVLGEWVAPKLDRQADIFKATAINGHVSSTNDGIWMKQDGGMVYVSSMLPDKTLLGIKIWRYGEDFQLIESIVADSAIVREGSWILENAQSSTLEGNRVEIQSLPERIWQTPIGTQLLEILLVKPEQMSFIDLTKYIDYLKNNQQQTLMYEVAWWNKLVYPITTMVMALLALSFTPVSSRHTNMGLKLLAGIGLGLLFFFAGRLFGFSSRLYGVPAWLSAILPTAVFAVWAVYLIMKHERR